MKKSMLAVLMLAGSCAPLCAKINTFEPWSPGLDTSVRNHWVDQGVNLRIGSNGVSPIGFKESDVMEFRYQASYGLTPDLEVGADWGFVSVDSDARPDGSGLGDLMLGTKYVFLRENKKQNSPTFLGEFAVSVPTGDEDETVGTGNVGIVIGLGLQKSLARGQEGHFLFSYRVNGETDGVEIADVLTLNPGFGMSINSQTDFLADLKIMHHPDSDIEDAFTEAYLAPGLRYRFNDWIRLHTALLVGLSGASSDIGFFAGLSF